MTLSKREMERHDRKQIFPFFIYLIFRVYTVYLLFLNIIPCWFSHRRFFAFCAEPLLQRLQQFHRIEWKTRVSLLSIAQDVGRGSYYFSHKSPCKNDMVFLILIVCCVRDTVLTFWKIFYTKINSNWRISKTLISRRKSGFLLATSINKKKHIRTEYTKETTIIVVDLYSRSANAGTSIIILNLLRLYTTVPK